MRCLGQIRVVDAIKDGKCSNDSSAGYDVGGSQQNGERTNNACNIACQAYNIAVFKLISRIEVGGDS